MTTPFSSASFPSNPTVPTQAPAGYTTPTTPPNPDAVNPPVSSEQMSSLRGNLLEMVLRQVVQALVGAFVPGAESAFNQLAAWAANIPGIGPIVTALTGIIDGDLTALSNWANNIPSDVVDNVALDPGKFFAEAMNVTGLTALWVNTIQPWLTNEFPTWAIVGDAENWVDGLLGIANNPTGSSAGSLAQQTGAMVASTASDVTSQAASATNAAVTSALTGGSPSATSSNPVANALDGVLTLMGQVPGLAALAPAAVAALGPVLPGVASNLTSHVVSAATPVVTAAVTAVDSTAPARGVGGEVSSVFENLAGLLANPTGSGGGSIVSAVTSQLAGSAGSGGDVVSNIASTLTQALTDAAGGGLSQADADISSRFGDTSLTKLLSEFVGLFSNPGGSGGGSLLQSIWQTVWNFINCNGLTGKGFTAGNNLTGVFSNPTGTTVGQLSGYVTDLVGTLFGNGGSALTELGKAAQDLASFNVCGLIGDLISFSWNHPSAAGDIAGILNFFSNPSLPSPTDITTGAKTAAGAAVSGAISALGLGNGNGGLSSAASNFVSDFMGLLGNPNGLGTGLENLALNELERIPIFGPAIAALTGSSQTNLGSWATDILNMLGGANGAGTGGFHLPTALQDLLATLLPAGVLTSNTPVPAHLLTAIAPGANKNVLPDPNFSGPNSIDGQGQWYWDSIGDTNIMPSGNKAGAVRTIRQGRITVYYLMGSKQIFAGGNIPILTAPPPPMTFLNEYFLAYPPADSGFAYLTSAIDPEHFEVIFVPYPAYVIGMNKSVAAGQTTLINLINQIPGKFILMGHSQGAQIISNVLDELRTGTMQARYPDLLTGISMGNPRRQGGRTFTDPVYGLCPDPGPGTSGMSLNNLTDTPDLWWEIALPGDFAACVDDRSTEGYWIRQLVQNLSGNTSGIFHEIIHLIGAPLEVQDVLQAFYNLITNSFAQDSPHIELIEGGQPLLPLGDTRTALQIAVDHINSFADQVTPPPGATHRLLGVPILIQPKDVLVASAKVAWINVNCTGEAFKIAVNVYNDSDELILTSTDPLATISAPATHSDTPQALSGEYTMPEGGSVAQLVLEASAEAMDTGTVWFGGFGEAPAVFEATKLVDAGKIGNVGNIDPVPAENVAGIQQMDNLINSFASLVDGMASATSQSNMSGVALADLYASVGQVARNASQALELATGLQQSSTPTYHPPVTQHYVTPGTYTFTLPSWIADGDLVNIAMVGGGGSGNSTVTVYAAGGGGSPGSWATETLTFGTDIPDTTTHLNVVVGAGGAAAPGQVPGFDGNACSVSGTGVSTLTAAGGAAGLQGGAPYFPSPDGAGPGDKTWDGVVYHGGVTVSQRQSPGSPPGGGSPTGYTGWAPTDGSGAGADGAVWITVRQPS